MPPKTPAKRVAKRFLEAMAYNREDFKNKVESHLTRAIVEFYKAALAKKNGQTKWASHWTSEAKQLVEVKLVAEILHPVRGFKDRRRAFAEAAAEIKAGDASYRRYAGTTIKKDYKLTRLTASLDDADTAAFWKLVDAIADGALRAAR